jgi:nucleotide-binding universal stress UspA family protein
VVGPRGGGGFPGLTLGSVAAQVTAHARCPVVIARERPAAEYHRRVVVGIDGTAASQDVLGFAFGAAAAQGVPLDSVFVWSVPQMSGLSAGTVWSRNLDAAQEQLVEAAERVQAEAMAGWAEKYPQVPVRRWTVHGDDPAQVLLDTAERSGAGLIVVGSRGEGAVGVALHGSVSRKVADRASMSVAVVHPAPAGHR